MESVVFILVLIAMLVSFAIMIGLCVKSRSRRNFRNIAVKASMLATICFVVCLGLYVFNYLNWVQLLILIAIIAVFDVLWLVVFNWAREKRRKQLLKSRSMLN